MTTTLAQLQARRGTASAWSTSNPILAEGEPGYELGTGLKKWGDGVTAWNALAYEAVTQAQVSGLTDALATAGDSLDPFFLMGA